MKLDPVRLMRWAEDVASDSTCAKIKVGAVLVTPRGQVISTGFNGTPPGHEHCKTHFSGPRSREALGEDEFLRQHSRFSMERELHAEENAITFADPTKLIGSSLFCTWSPCWSCAKTILTRGITVVYYRNVYLPEVIDYLSQFLRMERI